MRYWGGGAGIGRVLGKGVDFSSSEEEDSEEGSDYEEVIESLSDKVEEDNSLEQQKRSSSEEEEGEEHEEEEEGVEEDEEEEDEEEEGGTWTARRRRCHMAAMTTLTPRMRPMPPTTCWQTATHPLLTIVYSGPQALHRPSRTQHSHHAGSGVGCVMYTLEGTKRSSGQQEI